MENSIAHKDSMNNLGTELHPDGLVPWIDASPPDLEGGRTAGSLRSCAYCGSMHPEDVADAIQAGARGSFADRKYGWPHKAYFENIPNPHAGLLESRTSANFKARDDYVQVGEGRWREPGVPASKTTSGKFYIVHLQDATLVAREIIEKHLGLSFEFLPDGKVAWHPVQE